MKTESSLNEAQQRTVEIHEGPLLVIAGAGTGKTHTLVHRLVRLVEKGVAPESIVLLTFTRRAAEEMIARASSLLEGRCEGVAGGTFHSFANLLLRRYGRFIELASDFTILDQADTFEILSGIRTDMNIKGKGFPRRETIGAILSKAVNRQLDLDEVLAEEYPQFQEHLSALTEIGAKYERYKKERRLVDFDDLLVLFVRLLENGPEAAGRIHDRYRYIMVDEYQDTNILQARITHLLAGEARNVMVVGDDAQSIYGFRGANPRNLFEFEESFDDVAVVTLEQNYRSTQPILDVANGLMGQMSEAFQKRLFTELEEGERPRLVTARNEAEQARFVAAEIVKLQREGIELSEIGVLFRASRHAFGLEVELQTRGIPYVKYGGFKFMDSAHIKDVLAHLRVLMHPEDDLSLVRILCLREGIGQTGARRIQKALAGQPLMKGLESFQAKGKVRGGLDELAALYRSLEPLRKAPAECLERVIEAYEPLLKEKYDDWPRRRLDLMTLTELARRYRSMTSMLSDLALDPPTSARDGNLVTEARDEPLVLSTMHSAKGLEWPVVFIIQAREGYIPVSSGYEPDGDEKGMDEELRLLYVAATRAKDQLYIVWPVETVRGRFGWPTPSRFLVNLPPDLLDELVAAEVW